MKPGRCLAGISRVNYYLSIFSSGDISGLSLNVVAMAICIVIVFALLIVYRVRLGSMFILCVHKHFFYFNIHGDCIAVIFIYHEIHLVRYGICMAVDSCLYATKLFLMLKYKVYL